MFNRPDMVSATPAVHRALRMCHGVPLHFTLIAKTIYIDWELPIFGRAQGVAVMAYRGLIIRRGPFRQCFWDTPQRGALHSCRLRLPEDDAALDAVALHVWRSRAEGKGAGVSVDSVPWEIHAIEDPMAYNAAKAQFLANR